MLFIKEVQFKRRAHLSLKNSNLCELWSFFFSFLIQLGMLVLHHSINFQLHNESQLPGGFFRKGNGITDITSDKASITSYKISFHLWELWVYPRKIINILLLWVPLICSKGVFQDQTKEMVSLMICYGLGPLSAVSYKCMDKSWSLS